jgi:hypothetical protein
MKWIKVENSSLPVCKKVVSEDKEYIWYESNPVLIYLDKDTIMLARYTYDDVNRAWFSLSIQDSLDFEQVLYWTDDFNLPE